MLSNPSSRPTTTGSLPGLTKGFRIPHPMSAKGDPSLLNIRGSSTNNGFASYRDIQKEHYDYIIPTRMNESLDFPIKPRVKRADENRLSVDEVDGLVREKMRRERYAVQCLFKNADMHGQGYVTRGALLKILYSICGHVTVDLFHKLLERYGLDEKTVITFFEFESVFGPSTLSATTLPAAPSPLVGSGTGRLFSVAFANQLIRQFAARPNFCLRDLLPPSCFLPDGVVLMPQWREALARVNIFLSDADFFKFWQKFDREGCGSVKISQLCSILNLDLEGLPLPKRAKTAPHQLSARDDAKKLPSRWTGSSRRTPRRNAMDMGGPQRSPKGSANGEAALTPGDEVFTGDTTGIPRYTRRLQILRAHRPRYDSIMDCLYFLFEEVYHAMMVTFEHADQGGFVTLDVVREVLRGYGFQAADADFDKFATPQGLTPPRFDPHKNKVNYRELLDKFQHRGEFTFVNRMIAKICKSMHSIPGIGKTLLTPEELEMKIVEHLHGDYIRFLIALQRHDPSKKKMVPLASMRVVIDELLGFSMSDAQFEELKKYFKMDEQGDVFYPHFLGLFNRPTHICKKLATISDENLLKTSAQLPTPIPLGRDDSGKNIPRRTFYELCCAVEDRLKKHFHQVDKYYKQFERPHGKDTLSKAQFNEILESQNLPVSDEELDKLWKTLDPLAETKWSYHQIIRHFMNNIRKCALLMEQLARNQIVQGLQDPNLSRLREHRKQQRAQRVAEKRAMEERVAAAHAVIPRQVDQGRVNALCLRVRPVVTGNWEALKDTLRQLDQVGYATIEVKQMMEIAEKFNFGLTQKDLDMLCAGFDKKENGRFHYIDFLKTFVDHSQDPDPPRFDKLTHKLRDQLIHDWKSLLRAFRVLDIQRSGLLDVKDFRGVLAKGGINLSEGDLYHLLTVFDLNMDGKIDYQEFIQQTLNVF